MAILAIYLIYKNKLLHGIITNECNQNFTSEPTIQVLIPIEYLCFYSMPCKWDTCNWLYRVTLLGPNNVGTNKGILYRQWIITSCPEKSDRSNWKVYNSSSTKWIAGMFPFKMALTRVYQKFVDYQPSYIIISLW